MDRDWHVRHIGELLVDLRRLPLRLGLFQRLGHYGCCRRRRGGSNGAGDITRRRLALVAAGHLLVLPEQFLAQPAADRVASQAANRHPDRPANCTANRSAQHRHNRPQRGTGCSAGRTTRPSARHPAGNAAVAFRFLIPCFSVQGNVKHGGHCIENLATRPVR
ncbi:hypothetical protein [Pseudomonas sp. ES1]|uniref:hypothetical protein n=1 Tax=Pseudomonas sp. ES1 TaxID=3424775 RepID=UPI003D34C33A